MLSERYRTKYMIISAEFNPEDNTLVVSYYDQEGRVAFIKKPIQQIDLFNWITTPNPTEFRNWDNRFLKKSPSKWLSRFRIEELIESRMSKEDLAKIYGNYNPRKYFLDIEVKLINQDFPEPAKAEREVNLITFVNEENIIYTMSTTENFEPAETQRMEDEVNEYLEKCGQKFTLKYMYFENELALMTAFFKKILPKIPFLTGWNVVAFDWVYLINRAKKIGINPMEWMQCEKLIGQNKLPIHMGLLDYMEVFQNAKPYKVVENYKLDYIAELVLGVTKMHHEYGSMLEAQGDTFNFAKYNIVDTCLVKLMDDRLKLLEVAFAISRFAKLEVSKVFGNVFIAEILMCREFLIKNRFLANDKRDLGEETTYAGAYVMKPVPGFYK